MLLSALNRKLLREVTQLKGQVLTIALVLASGITTFIGMRGTYECLESARDAYYDRYRFAHVFASLERAPESLGPRIETLTGVAAVETRISEQVTLPLEGMSRPAYGRLLSLPAAGSGGMNAVALRTGRLPTIDRDDEVLVLESFAAAHGLRPGDQIRAPLRVSRGPGGRPVPGYAWVGGCGGLRPTAGHRPRHGAVASDRAGCPRG